jgi:hypothetical protein
MRLAILLVAIGSAAFGEDVCNPAKLFGPYAFQLSGTTSISGAPKPTASLGRIIFDGQGKLSGTSSAMFEGLLLGNPVTGLYEAKTDCTLTWKLQDDSGAYQNFTGTLSGDLSRGQFRQTDPGGAQRGVLLRISETCSTADLKKQYQFTVSGTAISMWEAGVSRSVSGKGVFMVEENSVQLDSDCTVRFQLTLAESNGAPMQMRGILTEGGREILAFQTDPGAMVAARFIASEPSPKL